MTTVRWKWSGWKPAKETKNDCRHRSMVAAQSFFHIAGDAHTVRRGPLRRQTDAHRRHTRPVRRAGYRQDLFPRSGPAGGGGSGYLPAHHSHAVCTESSHRARLFVLRRFLRLRDFRGRHGSVLGALAGAGIPQPGGFHPARHRQAPAWPGRHRRGLGLWLCAGGPHAQAGHLATAQPAGMVPEIRIADRARRVGNRHRRRYGQAIPGRGRSGKNPRLRHPAQPDQDRHPERQPGSRRVSGGNGRSRIHGHRFRLYPGHRRSEKDSAGPEQEWYAHTTAGCGGHCHRLANPPRHRRTERRRRSGWRLRCDALWRKRAKNHRPGQGKTGRVEKRPARWRGDRHHL